MIGGKLLVAAALFLSVPGCGASSQSGPASDGGPDASAEPCQSVLRFAGESRPGFLEAGTDAHAVLSGDFDGDGDADLVAAGPLTPVVSLLRNGGEGTYQEAETTSVEWDPADRVTVAEADLNGDDALDLVVGWYVVRNPSNDPHADGGLIVLLNDGDGRFAAQPPTPVIPIRMAVGDSSGDGTPDVVASRSGVSVLTNDGQGSFDAAAADVYLGVDATSLALTDVDGDGDLDVMVLGRGVSDPDSGLPDLGEGLLVGRNDQGRLEFGPAVEGELAVDLVASDLDGDGDQDGAAVVRALDPWSELVVYENDGAGGFVGDVRATLLGRAGVQAASDLDDDGDNDIVAVSGRGLSILLNDGGAAFTTERHAIGHAPGGVAIDDLDGDGKAEIVVSDSELNGVHVVERGPDGSFPMKTFPAGWSPEQTIAADLDGDGHPELVTANSGSDDAAILANDGAPFSGVRSLAANDLRSSAGGLYGRVEGVVAADFDGDELPDLALATELPGAVSLFSNRGNLDFEEIGDWHAWTDPAQSVEHPEAVAAGDLDGDGDVDLITADGPGETTETQGTITVLANDGQAGFELLAQVDVGVDPESLALLDVDGDGDQDIAVACEGVDTPEGVVGRGLAVVRSNSGPVFVPDGMYEVDGVPEALVAGDLDADGAPDLVVALADLDRVRVLWNGGAGDYERTTDIDVGREPRALAVADIDADGDLDILTANASSDDVTVIINEQGALERRETLLAGFRPMGVVVADLDGSCHLDLAITNKLSGDVRVLLSR